ncbi:hypothetical protein C9374_005317 [Naegleria lovaniensis]|uniref:Uncharacterized protein n=1 Tax=Naegleria lovaniensis TaxID=51637 RepID=A0AA88GQN5_NAELO|nr:uncharacterized protein C9374_005317 [Naegleria lovaniensis]KAG2382737.1 hypothetical protein C9374_005317 [Naegleria lovaniensis]
MTTTTTTNASTPHKEQLYGSSFSHSAADEENSSIAFLHASSSQDSHSMTSSSSCSTSFSNASECTLSMDMFTIHNFKIKDDLESQAMNHDSQDAANDQQLNPLPLHTTDVHLGKYYAFNNHSSPSFTRHLAKQFFLILESFSIWIIKSLFFPLISWTTIPIALYFLLMANFQTIAFKYMYSSEGEFFNQVDFDIIPKIDKTLMFGLGMPHSILANIYHPVLDFFFAIPYLNHFVFPLAFYPLIFCVLLWKPNREYLKFKIGIPVVKMIKELFQKNQLSDELTDREQFVNEPTERSYQEVAQQQRQENSSKSNPKISNYKLKCFILSLGIISLIQIAFCFFFPTAPPWFRSNSLLYEEYYNQFGSELTKSSPPVLSVYAPEARFEMIDKILGVELFGEIYGKGTIKFGAFYSLHVGWTAIIAFIELYVVFCENHNTLENDELFDENHLNESQEGCLSFARSVWCCQSSRNSKKNTWSFIQIFMLEYLLWIFIASIYSAHHYMIDGLVAILLAFVIVKIVTKYLVKDDTKVV